MNAFKFIIYLASLLFVFYFVYKFQSSFDLLYKLNLYHIGFLMLITMVVAQLQSIQFLKITRTLKQGISWKNISAITFISTMYNNILPAGGAVAVRTALLKKVSGIAWSEVTALMGVYYMISYLAMSFLLLVTTSVAYYQESIEVELFLSALLVCLAIIGVILSFFIFSFKLPELNRFTAFANRIIETVGIFKYRFRDHLEVAVHQIIIILLTGIRLYLSFLFLDVSIDFWRVIFIQSFISFSLVFSVTPGNIGIKEGLIVLFASFLAIDEDVALVGSLVDRGVGLLSILFMGSIGKIWLYLKFK